jgi:hypothetical protein
LKKFVEGIKQNDFSWGHTTVLRGVFGDSLMVTELQGAHEVLAGIPIHTGDGSGWESMWVVVVVLGPMSNGVVVLKKGVNDIGMSTAELVAFMPDGIAFVSNVDHEKNH